MFTATSSKSCSPEALFAFGRMAETRTTASPQTDRPPGELRVWLLPPVRMDQHHRQKDRWQVWRVLFSARPPAWGRFAVRVSLTFADPQSGNEPRGTAGLFLAGSAPVPMG